MQNAIETIFEPRQAEYAFGACADSEGPEQGLHSPLPESLDTIECINDEQIPGWDFAHVQGDVNPHIFGMLERTFLLDEAHLIGNLFSQSRNACMLRNAGHYKFASKQACFAPFVKGITIILNGKRSQLAFFINL